MAITNTDALIGALTAATVQRVPFLKLSQTAEGSQTFHSLWKAAGTPGAGNTPPTGAGEAPTDATDGAFPLTNPAGGNTLYATNFDGALGAAGALILYDRLVHTSGLSGTSVASQTVNSTALSRYTDGVGVEAWVEFYSAIGATGRTLTVTYTNQAGTGSRTGTYTHPANAESVGQMVPIVLQAGDTGVRSVESVQWDGSTGTAGDFGITLIKRIIEVNVAVAAVFAWKDAINGGMPEVKSDACLALMVGCSTTSTGLCYGMLVMAEG